VTHVEHHSSYIIGDQQDETFLRVHPFLYAAVSETTDRGIFQLIGRAISVAIQIIGTE